MSFDNKRYRAASGAGDSKIIQFDSRRKATRASKNKKSKQSKKYEKIVVAGVAIYAALFFVLKNFFDYPGCAAIIALNAIVFGLIKLGKLEQQALGSSYYSTITCKETYRVFTCAFTHFEPLHILFNLASLYNIGPFMERILGSPRFVLFYVLIMIVGGYISTVLRQKTPYTPSIGASGVICGIFGIYLAMAFIHTGFAGITSMIPTIVILLLLTFSPRIDSIGHFTGLVIGILCGMAEVLL